MFPWEGGGGVVGLWNSRFRTRPPAIVTFLAETESCTPFYFWYSPCKQIWPCTRRSAKRRVDAIAEVHTCGGGERDASRGAERKKSLHDAFRIIIRVCLRQQFESANANDRLVNRYHRTPHVGLGSRLGSSVHLMEVLCRWIFFCSRRSGPRLVPVPTITHGHRYVLLGLAEIMGNHSHVGGGGLFLFFFFILLFFFPLCGVLVGGMYSGLEVRVRR